MAAEDIGNLIPTKIPGYSDAADIQAALRLYHYGSYTFDVNETNKANLVNPSIAYTISNIQDQINSIDLTNTLKKTDFNAKGDLLSASADNTLSLLSVGTNGQVLTANSSTASGLEWQTPAVTLTNSVTLTNKTIALGSNTVSGTLAQFNTAVTDADLVSLAGSETLTNKTINLTSNTLTGTISQFNTALSDADFATIAGTETLTSKTLTAPVLNDSVVNYAVLKSPIETWSVSTSAATGTINLDVETTSVLYYSGNATANHTLNIRYNSSTTLNSKLANNSGITVVWMNTNGTTPYYPNSFTIDGTTVTPKWAGGTAPSGGNASSIDVYAYNIVKTASNTYTVIASQTKFA